MGLFFVQDETEGPEQGLLPTPYPTLTSHPPGKRRPVEAMYADKGFLAAEVILPPLYEDLNQANTSTASLIASAWGILPGELWWLPIIFRLRDAQRQDQGRVCLQAGVYMSCQGVEVRFFLSFPFFTASSQNMNPFLSESQIFPTATCCRWLHTPSQDKIGRGGSAAPKHFSSRLFVVAPSHRSMRCFGKDTTCPYLPPAAGPGIFDPDQGGTATSMLSHVRQLFPFSVWDSEVFQSRQWCLMPWVQPPTELAVQV